MTDKRQGATMSENKYLKQRVDDVMSHLPHEDAQCIRDWHAERFDAGKRAGTRRSQWVDNAAGTVVFIVCVTVVSFAVAFAFRDGRLDHCEVVGDRRVAEVEAELLECYRNKEQP